MNQVNRPKTIIINLNIPHFFLSHVNQLSHEHGRIFLANRQKHRADIKRRKAIEKGLRSTIDSNTPPSANE